MKNPFVSTLLFLTVLSTSLIATEAKKVEKAGYKVVNTKDCFMNSKLGRQEQESFEALTNQKKSLIEETSKQLQEIAEKLNDPTILDSMNPAAEQELKNKYGRLSQDLNQLYEDCRQILYQKEMQISQNIQNNIDQALEELKKEREEDCVILKSDACYYYPRELDLTNAVIKKLDEKFEKAIKVQNTSNNEIK